MTTTGIFIARADLDAFPQQLRTDLFKALFKDSSVSSAAIPAPAAALETAPQTTNEGGNEDEEQDEHWVDFSPAQARRFIRGCSFKTKKAVEVMVAGAKPQFDIADVARVLDVPVPSLTGVWSGLTRRARTVSGDEEGYLIWWSGAAQFDDDGTYVAQVGEMSETTHRSMRKALDL